MARESKAIEEIIYKLSTLSGIRVYEQVMIDKWNAYQFDYIGMLGTEDAREIVSLEDDSAFNNRGVLNFYLLVGAQVKKQNNGKANLRNVLATNVEKIENNLSNFTPERYVSNYENTYFSPLQFVNSQAITYNEDETKGISLVQFRCFYYKANS
jgi:hypothetical protein